MRIVGLAAGMADSSESIFPLQWVGTGDYKNSASLLIANSEIAMAATHAPIGLAAALMVLAAPALADDIRSPAGDATLAAFDIVRTTVSTQGDALLFSMQVSDSAGAALPTPTGQTAGSKVHSYVWPTALDRAQVGFEDGQGELDTRQSVGQGKRGSVRVENGGRRVTHTKT